MLAMGALDIEILMTHTDAPNVYALMSVTGANEGRDNWLLHSFQDHPEMPPATVNAYQGLGWRVWYRNEGTRGQWERMMTPQERATLL